MEEFRIRPMDADGDDTGAVERICREAFPEEDLVPLVRALASCATTLVGVAGADVVGFVVLTRCGVNGVDVALLGPLAVAPARQRRGVGDALVREALAALESEGVPAVCVLGDPRYYARLGFRPETDIAPPFELPSEWDGAWQSRRTGRGHGVPAGKLSVPEPWNDPTLWGP